MKRFFYMIFTVLLSACIVYAGKIWVQSEEIDADMLKETEIYAKGAVMIDGTNGRILWEKNAHEKLPMASTTKIMTCLLALEMSDLDDIVLVSDYAVSMPEVKMNMISGDQFYMKDLLYSLMLESNNDVAVAIAEHIGGSVEGFAYLMNERILKIGCVNTSFVTPNGLDADHHYTTAYDLARLSMEALKNQKFCEIITTKQYTLWNVAGNREYHLYNKNSFLNMMDGACGIKTGYTNNAGYCFAGAIRYQGKPMISVVLGSGWPPLKNYKWKDTLKIFKYGMTHYELSKIELKTHRWCPITIDGKKNVTIMPEYEFQPFETFIGENERITMEVVQNLSLDPNIKTTSIGKVFYKVNHKIIQEYNLIAAQKIEENSVLNYLKNIVFDVLQKR